MDLLLGDADENDDSVDDDAAFAPVMVKLVKIKEGSHLHFVSWHHFLHSTFNLSVTKALRSISINASRPSNLGLKCPPFGSGRTVGGNMEKCIEKRRKRFLVDHAA